MTRRQMLTLALGVEGGMLLLALALGWLVQRHPLLSLHFTRSGLLLGLLATIPLALLLAWYMRSRLPALTRLRREIDETILPLFANSSPWDILVISAVAGLGEEVLFRGLIQATVADGIGPLAGLVVASILFGLMHLVTPTYALLAGSVGAYLGWLFMASGNLLVPIVVHSVYDFVAMTFLLRGHRARIRNERPSGPTDEDRTLRTRE